MDEVFRALADPTRRRLLDALAKRDGQTTTSLVGRVARATEDMTRFGVMKHLRVLEAARLITVKKRGREKLHFLNVVPIRRVYDRWIDKYREPTAAYLSELQTVLERAPMEKVFEIYIKTSPERLFQAIIDPDLRWMFSFGVAAHSAWRVGAVMTGRPRGASDVTIYDGEVLEIDPPRKLVHTQRATWSDAARVHGFARVTWEIEQFSDSCRLIVTHDQLPPNAPPELYGGWPMLLSGLKTLLETGEMLTTPASLRFMQGETDRAMPAPRA